MNFKIGDIVEYKGNIGRIVRREFDEPFADIYPVSAIFGKTILTFTERGLFRTSYPTEILHLIKLVDEF